ncbi:MAG: ABC transporter ATP-binding protein [Clostridium argentinense]|nr:ABC transporter ATP-binding protein [Clostridium argentinense]
MKKNFKIITELPKKNKIYFISALFLVIIFVILNLTLPILIEKFINIVVLKKDFFNKEVKIILIKYILICVLIYIFSILKVYISDKLGWSVTNNLRIKLTKQIIDYDQNFFNKYSSADIFEIYDKDLNVLFSFLSKSLIEITMNLITILGVLIILFLKNIFIGLAFTIYILMSFIIIYKVQLINNNSLIEERKYNNYVTNLYNEIINCRKELNILGKINYIINKLEIVFKEWLPLRISAQKYLYKVWITTLVLLSLGNSISLMIGGFSFMKNLISIGTVYLLYSYSNMLESPMESMQMHIQAILKVRTSMKRVETIMKYESSVKDGFVKLNNENLDIMIKNISHSYNQVKVIKNLTLNINKSESIGIFGPSGSGKSTLCKLICKLEQIQEGTIYINSVNINDIDIKSLRENIGLLTTSSNIFNGTLKDNLTMFNSKITDEYILNFLNENDILNEFSFNCKDESVLNHVINDQMLSSGQKQLINICRIFFNNKRLIVFDESSSRIDKELDEKISNILDKLMSNCTSIIITHNIERLKKCDKILMLNEGKIVECDTKENLIDNKKSIYYRMLKKL